MTRIEQIEDLAEVDDASPSPDDTFEDLLKRAARTSGTSLSGFERQLVPGSRLLDGRLQIVRCAGEGGMGVVYEVHDERRSGQRIALKTLSRLDASGLYRLKNEFRSLVEVSHRNVCRLHELFGHGDQWFFTMELVDGEHFDCWVRPGQALDEERLRAALPQLLDGIVAIHQAGKLHRDLKPANVVVTRDGRVVVLDFGLATDPQAGGIGQTLSGEDVSGTPAYMAPEQAAGGAAGQASDLYALGVMLFESLTGRLPFEGRAAAVLAAKQRDDAPHASSVQSSVPTDLAELCQALLERDPERRPNSDAIRTRLNRTSSARPAPLSKPPERELLLGREPELAQLHAAYAATLDGRSVVLFVEGESGMGKSALVSQFLAELKASAHPAVLTGRCYEREDLPFKAFDALVDDLSRYLRRLTREAAGDLMPREMHALARLFPVLDRVTAVAEAPKKEIPNLQELQLRAFAAFGELLGRLRDRRPLVLFIDDLQWACRDSAVFMSYLLGLADPTPALLIASHRSESAAGNVLLQQIKNSAQKNPRLDCRTLLVGQLPLPAAEALARRLLAEATPSLVTAIASEAQGSPFFLWELSHHSRVARSSAAPLTLQAALLAHFQDLGRAERALLEVLAVAGRPLAIPLALEAAGVENESADILVAERLVRVASTTGAERKLECYHDKIRECALAALSPHALRRVHQALALELWARADTDPERLALHLHGAGDLPRAAEQYERAGDESARGLAFECAALRYEQALMLGCSELVASRALRLKLAAMQASAGRSRDAAAVYRAAALGAPPEQALAHTRAAAHLLMTSGYIDEGRVLLGEVLRGIGLSLPRSRRGALASALFARARLGFRGFELAASPAPNPDAEAHLAALWTVVQGSVGNDPFLMLEMFARYARLALDTADRTHAARALSMEAYMRSFDGRDTQAKTAGLLAQAAALAAETPSPELLGWVQEMRGCVLVHEGRFAEARPVLREALEWLTLRCKSVPFELACGRGYYLNAANHLGEYAHLATTAVTIVENSLRHGDMYQATGVASFALPAWLARLGSNEGKSRFEDAKHQFQRQSCYQWIDYLALMAELHLALYEGQYSQGLSLADEQWSALERSQLLRMHIARAMMQYLRAGCSLALWRRGLGKDGGARAQVQAAIRTLKHTRVLHAQGWAAALEAGLLLGERKSELALARLGSAIACFDETGLRMYAAAARRRLAALHGGERGRALSSAADALMATEGVRDHEATTEMLIPGLQ